MNNDKLSKRQQAIYSYICTYTEDHGYPPSVREIGQAVGLASPSTVHMHLKALQEHGLIKRDSKKPRTIEVVDAPGNSDGLTSSKSGPRHCVTLPLVGKVAAGVPILAEQNIEDTLTVPTNVVGEQGSFVLRVQGQSMVEIGILDGDYLIVKEQNDAQDGDIVVALIGDSATVKTFYREKDIIRLQPQNSSMEPIYVKNPIILGKVTGLFRTINA